MGTTIILCQECPSLPPGPDPDLDYLPDNHPLRRLRARAKEETSTPVSPPSLASLLTATLRQASTSVLLFHHRFYHDLLLTCQEGGSLLAYLVYPFPKDLFQFLQRGKGHGGVGSHLALLLASLPSLAMAALAWVSSYVTLVVGRISR